MTLFNKNKLTLAIAVGLTSAVMLMTAAHAEDLPPAPPGPFGVNETSNAAPAAEKAPVTIEASAPVVTSTPAAEKAPVTIEASAPVVTSTTPVPEAKVDTPAAPTPDKTMEESKALNGNVEATTFPPAGNEKSAEPQRNPKGRHIMMAPMMGMGNNAPVMYYMVPVPVMPMGQGNQAGYPQPQIIFMAPPMQGQSMPMIQMGKPQPAPMNAAPVQPTN